MIHRIRIFLCHYFSWHEMECLLENYKGAYELHRCRHCHLNAAVHWHTREVKLLSWR